jgi:hypothetical protein
MYAIDKQLYGKHNKNNGIYTANNFACRLLPNYRLRPRISHSKYTKSAQTRFNRYFSLTISFNTTGCFQITHIGISHIISNCHKINELDLSECFKIDDLAVSNLLQCTTLNILTLAECHKVLFSFTMTTNTTLKSLCLRHCLVNDDSVTKIITMCPELRILDLRL